MVLGSGMFSGLRARSGVASAGALSPAALALPSRRCSPPLESLPDAPLVCALFLALAS